MNTMSILYFLTDFSSFPCVGNMFVCLSMRYGPKINNNSYIANSSFYSYLALIWAIKYRVKWRVESSAVFADKRVEREIFIEYFLLRQCKEIICDIVMTFSFCNSYDIFWTRTTFFFQITNYFHSSMNNCMTIDFLIQLASFFVKIEQNIHMVASAAFLIVVE